MIQCGLPNPSRDKISLISCLTQTGVAAEHLFVHWLFDLTNSLGVSALNQALC